ncbi:hypothetical protein Trydic_g471 [Trypoxylus dichotomus]
MEEKMLKGEWKGLREVPILHNSRNRHRNPNSTTDEKALQHTGQRRSEPKPSQIKTAQLVYNLSGTHLDKTSKSVPTKGFSFAVAPPRLPTENIICGIEPALQKLDTNSTEIIRQEIASIIRKSKDHHPASRQRKCSSSLEHLLSDPSYKKITNDPTTYLEKVTRYKIKTALIELDTQTKVIPKEKSSRYPKLYGPPKICKPDVPLGPIVSSVVSSRQAIARYLTFLLQPHVEGLKLNSIQFRSQLDHRSQYVQEEGSCDTTETSTRWEGGCFKTKAKQVARRRREASLLSLPPAQLSFNDLIAYSTFISLTEARSTTPTPGEIEAAGTGVNVDGKYSDSKILEKRPLWRVDRYTRCRNHPLQF